MTILLLIALYDQDGTQTWQTANLVFKSSQCSLSSLLQDLVTQIREGNAKRQKESRASLSLE